MRILAPANFREDLNHVISHSGIGDLSTSLALTHHGPGHISRIGSRPAQEFARPTFASGAVLWKFDGEPSGTARRQESAEVKIAVAHRPHYDDWSLPKGKVDPGENLPGTALREIREETGFTARLGWLLGYVHYPVGSRTKVVYYWTAQVTDGEFAPNNEVDELRWVTFDEAADLLTYDIDRDVIAAARQMLSLGCDRRVLYIRHAKAHDRQGWAGDDNLRPLTKKGRRQSEMLVSIADAYAPEVLSSAQPIRCVHTATPMSEDMELDVAVDKRLGDEGWIADSDDALEAFYSATVRTDAAVSAVVAQGSIIPGVLGRLCAEPEIEVEDLRVKKSSVWVLHFQGEKLLGLDYLASPLPVK